MLIYDPPLLLLARARARDAPRILSRRICNVHRVILHVVFFRAYENSYYWISPRYIRAVLAPRGAIFENRERYRSIYDRATLISGLQRVAISSMDARDESGREPFLSSRERLPIMRICLFENSLSRIFPRCTILSEVHEDEDDSLSA